MKDSLCFQKLFFSGIYIFTNVYPYTQWIDENIKNVTIKLELEKSNESNSSYGILFFVLGITVAVIILCVAKIWLSKPKTERNTSTELAIDQPQVSRTGRRIGWPRSVPSGWPRGWPRRVLGVYNRESRSRTAPPEPSALIPSAPSEPSPLIPSAPETSISTPSDPMPTEISPPTPSSPPPSYDSLFKPLFKKNSK